MLFKKRELNEDQISKFASLGERIGNQLSSSRSLRRLYFKARRLGNRYPLVVVGFSMLLCFLTVGMSFYRLFESKNSDYKIEIPLPTKDISSTNYDDSIRIAKDGIEKIFIEAKAISDSIQTILAKPQITREDSIYVVLQGQYLESITNIMQK